MIETYYELSIEKTTYDPKHRRLTLSYYVARSNGMDPDDNIRKIKVHGKSKEVMFERATGCQYLYASTKENLILEIVK